MKTLKLSIALSSILLLINFTSCKKEKNDESSAASSGSFSYLSKTTNIVIGDYRRGNGDGAWIYFSGENYTDFVQIRFSSLGDYVIPTGTFTYKSPVDVTPYNTATNFKGGQVIINNVADELNGGTVTISKNGDAYTIDINAKTTKGTLVSSFKGSLKKI